MQRIVICCDGTWNRPDALQDGLPAPTNVVKLAEAIPREGNGVPQPMFYDPGVGTRGSWWRRLYDGATGGGLSRNILEAYRFIIQFYQPGDQLFLFGFSRGAFTVRSLAGLIRNSGILRREHLDMVPDAFRLYRDRTEASHPRGREAVLFRRTWAVESVTPVEFIGVWDTVGALGNPHLFNLWSPNRFHDTTLSSTVHHAFHALAIDERRRWFKATLWHQKLPVRGQVLEQVWFAGVHSNIGGGYAAAGLSDIALTWMLDRARSCGLVVNELDLNPDPMAPRMESRRGFYRLVPTFHRPIGRATGQGETSESVHESALLRRANDRRYRPPSLEDYLRRHPQPAGTEPASIPSATS